MTLAVSGASSGSLFSSGSDWISGAYSAIQASKNSGGLLGMLEGAAKGTLGKASATSFALIAQNSVGSSGSFYAQIAQANEQKRADKLMQKAFEDLERARNMVQAKNVLDPVVFFTNGSSLDTDSNILTMPDGTQYDATTGALYVDPSYIVQMANGAYLDTKNNILTMADGTKVDTVTGLKISKTA